MKSNKGISMGSLVITIILIIIIAGVTTTLLSSIINESLEGDAKAELKNAQSVVESAKALIIADEFEPDPQYIISDEELDSKFALSLSPEERGYIKEINNDPNLRAPYKYYLMDRDAFEQQFADEVNVNGIRKDRLFLVNYMEALVMTDFQGKMLMNRTDNPVRNPHTVIKGGGIDLVFYPNGNSEWKRQQATSVRITPAPGTEIKTVRYLWSESITEPAESEYLNDITLIINSDGRLSLDLLDKTGNGWYLWVLIKYADLEGEHTSSYRSEAFYIDNAQPSASFDVDEIRK